MIKIFQSNANDYSNTLDVPDLNNIFNFDNEQECYKGQYLDSENKIPYERWQPIEQKRWENFKAKCIDAKTGKWYTSGDGTGICQGTIGPERKVYAIIRILY